MSPLFPPSEVNSPHNSPRPSYITMSPHNSARPSYQTITTEEFRDVVIKGIQKDVKGSIEEKLKIVPDPLNINKDLPKKGLLRSFTDPIKTSPKKDLLRSFTDPIKTSPKNEFSIPNRSYSDPIKTSRGRILSDSLKTSPKKAISKFKDYVDGPGYVEPASPARYKVERTSAAVKGLYGLEHSEKNTLELKSPKKGKGVYYKKR